MKGWRIIQGNFRSFYKKFKLANSKQFRHNIRTMKDQNIYEMDYADVIREALLEEMNSLQEIKMELDISSSWEYPVLNNYLLLYVSYR